MKPKVIKINFTEITEIKYTQNNPVFYQQYLPGIYFT